MFFLDRFFFLEIDGNFFKTFFLRKTLAFVSLVPGLGLEHSCPWPWPRIFLCVLGLGFEPCVLDSSSGNQQRWSREHNLRGQRHKKNPRPRTDFSRTDPLEAKPRTKDTRRNCSPKKMVPKKFLQGDIKKKKGLRVRRRQISAKNQASLQPKKR